MPAAIPDQLSARIDALLPQTQCTRCGYPACLAYAQAIARGEADINRCPPGGAAGIELLAALLDRPVKPLNPANGSEKAAELALIDEDACIGCTKCIQACPVDAITGAAKQMHAVIEVLCTGCGLCLPPCPVDCIRLEPAEGLTEGLEGWHFPLSGRDRADALRERYGMFKRRSQEKPGDETVVPDGSTDLKTRRQAEIAAALARERARRGKTP